MSTPATWSRSGPHRPEGPGTRCSGLRCLVAVGAVAVIGRGATTASAAPALPKPLAFSHGSSAEGVTLLEYAAVAQQNAPSRSGPVYYAKTQNYALQVTVGNHRSTSVVATTVRQVWRSPDGSTLVREYLQDTAPAGGDIGGPNSPGNLDHSGRYRPGQWADLNVGFPVDRAAAQVALHNPNTDRTPSLVNITLAYEIIQHLESGTANPRQTGVSTKSWQVCRRCFTPAPSLTMPGEAARQSASW